MTAQIIEYLDQPPAGWFALDVMQERKRKSDWVALMVNVDPDSLKTHAYEFPVPGLVLRSPKRASARGAQGEARMVAHPWQAQEQGCRLECIAGECSLFGIERRWRGRRCWPRQ